MGGMICSYFLVISNEGHLSQVPPSTNVIIVNGPAAGGESSIVARARIRERGTNSQMSSLFTHPDRLPAPGAGKMLDTDFISVLLDRWENIVLCYVCK